MKLFTTVKLINIIFRIYNIKEIKNKIYHMQGKPIFWCKMHAIFTITRI